jgi:hypothetical protein
VDRNIAGAERLDADVRVARSHAGVKSNLRKGAARTVLALWKLVGHSVKAIAPSECAGYFRHAGYHT